MSPRNFMIIVSIVCSGAAIVMLGALAAYHVYVDPTPIALWKLSPLAVFLLALVALSLHKARQEQVHRAS